MRLVFDLESNGLLDNASRIHCIVTKDIDTGEICEYEPSKVVQGIETLMKADVLIGHNVIGFDLALISKLHPWFASCGRVIDTLVLSRLLYSDLSDSDRERCPEGLDAKLYGSHSLKAWGQRIGLLKGDYSGGWEEFSAEMLSYNRQDVVVTERLYQDFTKHRAYSQTASDLEHSVADIVARQERAGFPFDANAAYAFTAELQKKRQELVDKLQDTFKPFYLPNGYVEPKKSMTRKGVEYTAGHPYTKIKLTVFNPGSRMHIAQRLKALRGWTPDTFTNDGSPKVDETVLSKLPYPEAKLLAEYFMVQKRLGMLSDGDGSWIKYNKQGRIHGSVVTNGAVTGRATHRNPNIAQVPAVGAPYGKECRSLFTASRGRKLVGIDVSGLELRMLAHFMARYDGGKYGKEVVEGDVHTANQLAAGLETRNQAKTFIYAFLYGAGDEKIGKIVGKGAKHGKQLKRTFLERTPALAKLIDAVKKAADRGYLVGLDGRHVSVRSNHAALNTLLQSAGALVCKQWMVEVDRMITDNNWHSKVQQVAWVHDECQFDCDPDIADEFGKEAVVCIGKAGRFFHIHLPLTGEYKVGNNWAETH